MPPIVNTALAFIAARLQVSPADTVARDAAASFSPEAILCAKDILWNHCRAYSCGDSLGEKTGRRDTSARPAHVANCKDIVEAIKKLDKKENPPLIAVDAIEVLRAPSFKPVDASITQVASIAALEQAMQAMQNQMALMREEIAVLIDSRKQHCHNEIQHEMHPPLPTHNRPSYSEALQRPPSASSPTRPKTMQQVVPDPVITVSAGARETSVIVPSAAPNNSENEFQVPAHVEKKRRRQERRSKVVTGSKGDAAGLKGAPVDLFVFRADKDSTVEGLRQLVESQGCEVRGVEVKSHENARFKSFKLSVSSSQLNVVLNEDFPWPDGVKVTRFYHWKKKPAAAGAAGSVVHQREHHG